MTNEELMKPRCKAIAPDTSGNFEVGEIFYPEKNGSYYFYGDNGKRCFAPKYYPHLFRELEWWEDRNPEDMPEFIKDATDGEVSKPIWRQGKMKIGKRTWSIRNIVMCFYSPATEEEYLAHIKNTQNGTIN